MPQKFNKNTPKHSYSEPKLGSFTPAYPIKNAGDKLQDLWNDDPITTKSVSKKSKIEYVKVRAPKHLNIHKNDEPPTELNDLLKGYEPVKAPNKLTLQWQESQSNQAQPVHYESEKGTQDPHDKNIPTTGTQPPHSEEQDFISPEKKRLSRINQTNSPTLLKRSPSPNRPIPRSKNQLKTKIVSYKKKNKSTRTHVHTQEKLEHVTSTLDDEEVTLPPAIVAQDTNGGHTVPRDTFHADYPIPMKSISKQELKRMIQYRLSMILKDQAKYQSVEGLDFYLILAYRSMNYSYYDFHSVYKVSLLSYE